jgi:hypothetical protein
VGGRATTRDPADVTRVCLRLRPTPGNCMSSACGRWASAATTAALGKRHRALTVALMYLLPVSTGFGPDRVDKASPMSGVV